MAFQSAASQNKKTNQLITITMRKSLLLYTILLLGLAACTPDDIPVASVTLNYNTAILAIGETKTKIATVLPENATNRSITWTSSNPVVATVNTNGEVHAIAEGTAIITVTTQDGGRTAISTVIVSPSTITPAEIIITPPHKTKYKFGEAFRIDGLEVHTSYGGHLIPVTNFTLILYDEILEDGGLVYAEDIENNVYVMVDGNIVGSFSITVTFPDFFAIANFGNQIDFAILGLDGSAFFYQFQDENPNIPKRVLIFEGGKDDVQLVVNFDESGLPTNMISEEFTIVLGNFMGNKFDAVVILRSGETHLLENIETDINWEGYLNSLLLGWFSEASIAPMFLGRIVRNVVQPAIRAVSVVKSAVKCGTSIAATVKTAGLAAPLAVISCTGAVVGAISMIGELTGLYEPPRIIQNISNVVGPLGTIIDCGKAFLNPAEIDACKRGIASMVSTRADNIINNASGSIKQGNEILAEAQLPPQTEEGVVINGIRWATRNVDAPGTFADAPESTGMFYQWNRRQSLAATRTVAGWSNNNAVNTRQAANNVNLPNTFTLIPESAGIFYQRNRQQARVATGSVTSWDSRNVTNVGWTKENDPCPEGWRVPTLWELRSLVDAGSIWTTKNGVVGRFFGTATNQIFLPAAGFSWGNGEIHGGTGYYWSSTTEYIPYCFGGWAGTTHNPATLIFGDFGDGRDVEVQAFCDWGEWVWQSVRCVADVSISVESIAVNRTSITIPVTGTTRVSTIAAPANATNQAVTWSSSNEAVATVNEGGAITAVSAGTAFISASTTDGSGRTATVTVTVENINISSSLDGVIIDGIRWATRNVDGPGTLAQNPTDAGMFYQWNRRLGWSATDPLFNSDGGTTWSRYAPAGTSWARANDPCPAGWRIPTQNELQSLVDVGSFWVTYNGVRGRLFGTSPNQIFLLAAGARCSCHGALYDDQYLFDLFGRYWSNTTTDIWGLTKICLSFTRYWVSANWGIASTHSDGHFIRCVADESYIFVQSVSLNQTSATLAVNETIVLTTTISPVSATNQTVRWASDNSSVATVDAWGNVTAVSTGTTIITVTTECGNRTDSVEITVQQPSQAGEGVVINGIRWATRNVDAPGTFAAHPESVGMHYQWNRRIGWTAASSIPVADWDQTSDTGAKWEAQNDPCPEGWRVPTEVELRSLYNKSSIPTILNGVNGRLFGSAPYQIFLPAAGSNRDGWICVHGRYWSSTTCAPGGGVAAALMFSIDDPWGRSIWLEYCGGPLSTSNALSVRCVADESIPVQSVTLNKTVITLIAGDTETLTPTIFPESATNQNVW